MGTIAGSGPPIGSAGAEGPGPAFPYQRLNAAITAALGDDTLAAEIVGPSGRPVAWSDNLDGPLPIPPDALRQIMAGAEASDVVAAEGDRFQLYGKTLSAPRGPPVVGAVVVAGSLRPGEATLARWRTILALTVLGTTGLVAAIGWFVASQAMRPVDRMTRAARAIGQAADFGRLPEPEQRDELGRLARTFNEMLTRLSEAHATQTRFLADASHELRTPLTTVRTNVETLLRGAGDDPAERTATLRAIAQESDRMGRLVNDLLALARADAGQSLDRRRLALDTLALEVYQQERAVADGARFELGEWDQVAVDGDPDRLKQAVLNLVDNALRYTPRGGAVTLDLFRRDDEAVLRVRDTGPGIPPEHLGRVFERFYRVDQPRSRQAGGTGLGLAIAREVAEAHGGRIEVASRVGEGSAFSLVLPALDPAAADAGEPSQRPTVSAQTLTSA